MNDNTTATLSTVRVRRAIGVEHSEQLRHTIEHAAHLLPAQGPITTFVHHNTLHAFEDLPFHQAVQKGSSTFGCHAYLPEDRYRQKLARGRILAEDISATLIEDVGGDAERIIGFLGTRYHLRLAMLQYPLRLGADAELRWLIAEADALRRFRADVPIANRDQMIEHTRRWVMRDLRNVDSQTDPRIRAATAELVDRFGKSNIEQWDDATWEAFTLHLLWYICRHGVQHAFRTPDSGPDYVRHRDLLKRATNHDSDSLVNEILIRFCAAFLDQGVGHWSLPERKRGFLRSFSRFYAAGPIVERWLRGLAAELERIERYGLSAEQVIGESLAALGVSEFERDEYLTQTLLALRGWAGMIWQMETNAPWAVHPAPGGSLVEYVAVRLLLERLAVAYLAEQALGDRGDLDALRERLRNYSHPEARSVEQESFLVFQLAQALRWHPGDLYRLSSREWSQLLAEIDLFSGIERRRIYHLAFERRYRNEMLDALVAQERRRAAALENPRFQIVCCIDEREESFRRHIEETAPDCETFGAAGFFGVAMYYRGVTDAHYVPLCPVVVKPAHWVEEEIVYSFAQSHRRRTRARQQLGKATHRVHKGSRSVLEGALAAIFGPLASVPLVARVLFPRLTAQVRRAFGSFVQPPPISRLLIERDDETAGPDNGHRGYSVEEMTAIVGRLLRDIGLTKRFSRLVVIMGHGSSSLNNPHNSAYDCGACGGGRGGPNARAFANMANDPRIRERLAKTGLVVPRHTVFVGGLHNTCNDSVQFYDLDRLPSSHRDDFEAAARTLEEARKRNAHERCRRFESAPLNMSSDAALRHVEGRAEDLSQVRAECGHATNASCFVGRRERTRGLFLDRRAFLTSYDPTQDDEERTILTRILQAVIPVCAGINLEYYFSYVDPAGYGCGTKLPHNITSLLGVMDGAASDLRPGLPWQMVEIHEPMRLLFVIETTPVAMQQVLEKNPPLRRLVANDWVQLATLDPERPSIHLYRNGEFELYHLESRELPIVHASLDWYRGWRDHLGFASVLPLSDGATENGRERH